MVRQLFVALCLVLTGLGGAGLSQPIHANASAPFVNGPGNGNGVGPSDGITGPARACEVHALNDGDSLAVGMTCSSFGVTVGPGTSQDTCTMTFSGTGLMPGSYLTDTVSGDPTVRHIADIQGQDIVVAPDGTINDQAYFYSGYTVTFTVQTASGGTLSQTVTC